MSSQDQPNKIGEGGISRFRHDSLRSTGYCD